MENETKLLRKVELIDELIRRGELIKAFDLAKKTLLNNKNFITLKHRAVLCLVNAGALKAASEEFVKLGLDRVDEEEVLCLYGKILKSFSVTSKNKERECFALLSVEQYKKAYALNKNFYPGINLATVLLLSGNVKGSRAVAKEVLNSIDDFGNEESYYMLASKAEAFLLLNELQETKINLSNAISKDPANYRAHASTIKQFELIVELQKKSCKWLDDFRPPSAIYYGGYIFSITGKNNKNNNLSMMELHNFEELISKKLKTMNIGYGYGSLAAGSDIIIAETVLAQAAELNVVLPLNREKFIEQSVAPFGKDWVERFNSCIERATSVHVSSENLYSMDEALLKFSSQVAMGKTILRAGTLATDAQQLLIWAGEKNDQISITHSDYKFWQRTGFKQEEVILPLTPNLKGAKKISSARKHKRTIAAMIFADFNKFSELNEEQVSIFSECVLNPLSKALRQSAFNPFEVNTWGDGLFLAFESVLDAANCSLLLQDSFSELDLVSLGLPEDLSLRIGANYGPVFSGFDAFLEKPTVFGPNVTFAARIEPITVPGSIYVSESFASVLAAQPNAHFNCEYIGLVKLNKSKKLSPIYSIHSTI